MLRMRATGLNSGEAMTKEVEGLAGWILGRFRASRRLRAADRREMNLLETLHLGGKRQLMLVECGGERFLVGGGVESVETIVQVSARACVKEENGHEEYR